MYLCRFGGHIYINCNHSHYMTSQNLPVIIVRVKHNVVPTGWLYKYRQVDTYLSRTVTHQLLAVVVFRVRVKRILSTGIAIMLLRGIQRQRGLVPAWGREGDTCLVYVQLERLSNVCLTCIEVWKNQKTDHKRLFQTEKEKQLIPGTPDWHKHLPENSDWGDWHAPPYFKQR